MVKQKRLELLTQFVKEKKIVSLEECTVFLDTSESTVRRDFEELEQKGILRRFHGGAEYTQKNKNEIEFSNRLIMNTEAKTKIAEYAASLIEDGETIFIDAGSTTIGMIPFIKGKNVRVVTNGVTHISPLLESGVNTYIVGGVVKTVTSAIVGEEAEIQLNNYYFDKAFLGINSISKENGFSTPDMREAIIKRIVVNRTKDAYFLATSEKFDTNSFSKVVDLDKAKLITDEINLEYKDELEIIKAK